MTWSEKEKDKTPYLVFPCSKCNQFLYSKLTQKTRKCLRCGKIYTISSIKMKGEIINGLSNAFKYVKEKQNEIAIDTSGSELKFNAFNDFSIAGKTKNVDETPFKPILKADQDEDYENQFILLLQKISNMYKEFPIYLIELMADEFKIPISLIESLINRLKVKGKLIPLSGKYFKVEL